MFGFIGSLNALPQRMQAAQQFIETNGGDIWVAHDADASSLDFATYGGAAPILGFASGGGLRLCYLGAIHAPFPGRLHGSPLDDPSATANTLLERFLDQGDAFLDGVVGSYCLALMDDRDGSLRLARDPFGASRLFLYESGGEVLFATRLLDFVGLLGDDCRLDRSYEDFLLGYEFLPDDLTLYAGVRTLPKGTLVTWCSGTRSERSIQGFQTDQALLYAAGSGTESQVVDALYRAFAESLQDQCQTTGKIGVLLGGFDSMLIASVLVRMGREVETFTFRYQEEGYTQQLVDEFQQHVGIRHNWVDITPALLNEGLERFPLHFNQPVGQAHYLIATAEAARVMAKRGVAHCITGDGCDGLFLGYPTVHARARFVQATTSVRGVLAPILIGLGSSKWLEQRLGHPYRFFRNLGRTLSRPMPARGHIAACTLDQTSLRFLRTAQPPQRADAEAILMRLSAGLESVQPLRLAYMGKGRVGLNANKLEGAMRTSGISFLSPYLHPRMAAIAARIPDDMNRPKERAKAADTGKYVFMSMVDKYDLLPSRFVHQRKMSPVTAPVDFWYWGELHEVVLTRLKGLPFSFDRDYTVSLMTPKAAEHWFRKRIGISRYVNQATSLLATYAAFTGPLPQQPPSAGSKA